MNTLKNDANSLKLALFLLFLNKGVPSIYYGTEIGLSGGAEPECRESFNWESNYSIDLRGFLKSLTKFRRTYISLIKLGVNWQAIGKDVLFGTLNTKNVASGVDSQFLSIFVNRS